MNLATINKKLSEATAALAKAEMDLKLEIAGAAADAAGIIDPTPTSDLIGAGISVARGDYAGAALSVASMLPYLGDALAKPVKAARNAKKAIELEKKIATLSKTVNDLKKAKKEAEAASAVGKQNKIISNRVAGNKNSITQEQALSKKDKDCEDCGRVSPIKRMKEVRVTPCFSAKRLPHSKAKEFSEQLSRQESALNDISVEEFLKARAHFKVQGRSGHGNAQKQARKNFEKKEVERKIKEFRMSGMRAEEAEAAAIDEVKSLMENLAALHEPDMIAGGKDKVTTMGDKRVNSSIGSQWRSRIKQIDKAAKKVPAKERASTKMNAKLPLC